MTTPADVLTYFKSIVGRHAVSGQFIETGPINPINAIQASTGKWLGMIGGDYWHFGGTGAAITSFNAIAKSYWTAGGLITLTLSMPNPFTNGYSGDVAGVDPNAIITNGTASNTQFKAYLDQVAVGLSDLQSSGVVVMLRPFHELNGTWFWWGAGNFTGAQFQALWQYTYNYLTTTRSLRNLLWLYSVNAGTGSLTAAYPGAAYVDITGFDIYTNDPGGQGLASYNTLVSLGKPVGLTEFGPGSPSLGDTTFQETTLIAALKAMPNLIFWQQWWDGNGGNVGWGIAETQNATAALTDPWVVNRGDFSIGTAVTTGTRLWYQSPGQDGSFWVQPFKTTAQWTTTGAAVTMLRNGSFASPTGNINVKGNFAVPWVIGVGSDPLVQVTNGTRTINVRIPLGTIVEQPASVNDQSIGGIDSTQPYLCWAISGATINTGSVQASGSVITGTYGMSISDGAGPLMMDAVTVTNGVTQNDNAFGQIQDYELSLANANPNYIIQHMLTCSLDPQQVSTAGPVWPTAGVDTSFPNPGLLPQGQTYGIPASTVRPTGQTRGFYLLFDNAQQFGWLYYNVASAGCLTIQAYSNLAGNASLITDLKNSIGAVMGYLCILSNQTGLASQKGMALGGIDAFPAPPRLDLSPTGGVAVAPSTFGAWYPSGYNVIPTPPAAPASLAVTTPTQQNANASFAVSGTMTGYSTAPTLNYRNDAGVFVALPAGFTVTATTFTFANPGLAAGSHTVSVRDANNTAVVVSTGSFNVVTASVPVVTPTAPSMPAPGLPFTLSGSLANYASAPALTFADDGAASAALPVGSTVTTTAFSFLHPALALGSHTSVISDGTNSGSVPYSVTAISGGASPSRTVITPNSGSFTDLAGNRWTVTVGGQVALNGVVDSTTSNVIQMAWVNGVIWQENSSLNWYSKANASAPWSAATTTSPLATSPTIAIAAIASQPASTAFQVTGSLANYGTLAPTLTYADNGGPATAFPAGSTVTPTTFSFLHPGMPNGTQSLQVSDGGFSNTVSYSVAAAGWTSLPSTTLLTSTIAGLAVSTAYDVQIFASNAIGQGPASAILTLTTAATLPNAPTGLTAAAPSNTSVALSWTAPTTGTTPFTYHILQSPTGAGTFVDVGTSATTAYTATGLTAATGYDFKIFAANGAGNGPASTLLTVTTTPVAATIPGAVTGLAAGTPTATGVTLTWTAPTTGTTPFTYNVMQSPKAANTFVNIGTPSAATFAVTGLTGSTSYDFRVFASNAAGSGANSGTVSVTTAAAASTLPGAPSGISASTPASTSLNIQWVAPSSGTVPTKYTVQYKQTTTGTWSTFSPSVGVSKNLLSTDTGSITDVSGNVWTIVGGQVAVGGVIDATTSNVVQLSYVANLMWQKNNAGNWWSKTSPTATWTGGTTTGPVLVVTLLAGAGGSITDASANVWTIVGGQVAVGGVIDATTSNVVELDYVGVLMWQKNNVGTWWSKTSPTATWTGGTAAGPVIPGFSQAITGLTAGTAYNFQVFATNGAGAGPASSPVITATTAGASTGLFGIANAQIIAPNGTVFFAKGINIYDGQLQGVVNNAQGGMLTTLFPHINIIRVPCYSYSPPSSYEPAVSRLTALGIVVLLENHQSSDGQNRGGGTGVVFTGALLQTESNWFAALAAAYINNPYVWLGTNNEPPNSYTAGVVVDQGSLTSWQVTTYNAIRGTGNKNPILLQEFGGGLPFAMGKDNTQGLWPSSSYAGMINVYWDVHQYNWVSNYSTDVPTILSTMNTMVAQAQQTTSADGKCPCIIGEYGPSSDGSTFDAGGNQMVTAVQQSAFGSTAWAWASGAASDNLTDGNNNLTNPYGLAVAAFIG